MRTGQITIQGKAISVAVDDGNAFVEGVPYEEWMEKKSNISNNA